MRSKVFVSLGVRSNVQTAKIARIDTITAAALVPADAAVYTYEPVDNGAGPMRRREATCAVRTSAGRWVAVGMKHTPPNYFTATPRVCPRDHIRRACRTAGAGI